jgi:hypothetical protein
MSKTIEELYQEIGREAVAIAGKDRGGRLLVTADVVDRAVSADLFYKNRKGDVLLVLGPPSLMKLAYELWERWKEEPGNEVWRLMSYVVDDDGKLTIDLTYPDDVDDDEDDLRLPAIKKYFGTVKVVESNR